MIIKKKAIKQKRNYYRPKVHTNQTTIYLSDKIESTWVKKATESGMTKKEWVSCAISDYNLPWIEESKKKEKPLSKRDQKQLESVYRRRRRGEFTQEEKKEYDIEGRMMGYCEVPFGADYTDIEEHERVEWYAKFKEFFGVDWYAGFDYDDNIKKQKEEKENR